MTQNSERIGEEHITSVLAYLGGKHVGHRQGKETWIDSALDGEIKAAVSQGLSGF